MYRNIKRIKNRKGKRVVGITKKVLIALSRSRAKLIEKKLFKVNAADTTLKLYNCSESRNFTFIVFILIFATLGKRSSPR